MITNSMFGLGVLALGILGVIVSLSIADRRRFLTGILLSGLIVLIGGGFLVNTSLREWRTARRIAKIREANRKTLEEYRRRLQDNNAPSTAPAPRTAAATAPAADRPASAARPARPARR